MSTVLVQVSSLASLADIVCNRDALKRPATPQEIDEAHKLIIKMLGDKVGEVYALETSS